jgi:16S rRNA (uracil1498-N3)-methyltransferase
MVAVGDVIELVGDEGRHAAKVMRLGAGERLQICDGHGVVLLCEVVGVKPEALSCQVISASVLAEPSPRFVVVQALCKGDRGELAVETMTELGVDEIVPWSAARSIVQWQGPRGEKAQQKWVNAARTATKQSRRARLPVIAELATTKQVRSLLAKAEQGLVLHESATVALTGLSLPSDGTVVVVVGPEGGISEEELALFTDAGAATVRLGREVLRTSTAGAATLAALATCTGRW